MPSQRQASEKPSKAFDKCRFVYDEQQDCYYCPAGQRLVFRRFQDKARRKRGYRIETPGICRACVHFGECTMSKQGRTVVRHVLEALKEQVEARYEQPELRAIYDCRKARVEHPFGYMKKVLDFRQFSLRGRNGAQAEASLLATCFNLRRMITLWGGVPAFIEKMASV